MLIIAFPLINFENMIIQKKSNFAEYPIQCDITHLLTNANIYTNVNFGHFTIRQGWLFMQTDLSILLFAAIYRIYCEICHSLLCT